MNPREEGFLLLSSHLGNPDRRPLTQAQLQVLAKRISMLEKPAEDRFLSAEDLLRLGYSGQLAEHILSLLAENDLLHYYCSQGNKQGCIPLTRVSRGYPSVLRLRLGLESPGCLWAKGNIALLNQPSIALVGSRELMEKNRTFAKRVGEIAAENGWVLVSGNARGADQVGQTACLEAGGNVICILADQLCERPESERVLYLSEDGFSEPFSAQRALSRNRCIHALGYLTFVAQCALNKGGTWKGTTENLHHGWSNVVCFRDGSEAIQELSSMGAYLLDTEELGNFDLFPSEEKTLFDM